MQYYKLQQAWSGAVNRIEIHVEFTSVICDALSAMYKYPSPYAVKGAYGIINTHCISYTVVGESPYTIATLKLLNFYNVVEKLCNIN